jgi:hypothetical protein
VTVTLTSPYTLEKGDSWVVTRPGAGGAEPGQTVLRQPGHGLSRYSSTAPSERASWTAPARSRRACWTRAADEVDAVQCRLPQVGAGERSRCGGAPA